MIGLFCSCHSIFLSLPSDEVVLNGNDVLSILVVSTKKQYSSFLKKVFVFKVLKTFETFTDCYIKTCRYLKQRATLKIASTVFNARSTGFKMKNLGKSVFEC